MSVELDVNNYNHRGQAQALKYRIVDSQEIRCHIHQHVQVPKMEESSPMDTQYVSPM